MDELREKYNKVLERVDWCCPNRHGVIRSVGREEQSLVGNAIVWFFGSKGQWWKQSPGQPKGVLDVEFVHMCKVSPPPKRPWEWCGKTILFEGWKEMEEKERELKNRFKIGQTVSFFHKEKEITGFISAKNKRARVLIPGSETWWNVPYSMLNKR